MKNSRSVVILTYHRLFEGKADVAASGPEEAFYALSSSVFENHLFFLRSQNFQSVFLEDLLDPAAILTNKTVVLTFDDGHASDFLIALPILEKYGFKAVFFVCLDLIGAPGYMGWPEIKQLVAAGMSIQSHGLMHRDYSLLPAFEATQELQAAKNCIERNLGTVVRFLSLPGGFANSSVYRAGFSAGFSAICNSEQRRARPGSRILNRFVIRRGITQRRFQNTVLMEQRQMFILAATRISTSLLKSAIGRRRYELVKQKLRP